jgi:hypothetical protein
MFVFIEVQERLAVRMSYFSLFIFFLGAQEGCAVIKFGFI